jgi:CheY-specific phosphatase CheX
MKSVLSLVAVLGMMFGSMQVAVADVTAKKVVRNDRVSVNKSVKVVDINPFLQSKRVVRNDRVSYQLPKPEVKKSTTEKKRVIRNDRVVINQLIERS